MSPPRHVLKDAWEELDETLDRLETLRANTENTRRELLDVLGAVIADATWLRSVLRVRT